MKIGKAANSSANPSPDEEINALIDVLRRSTRRLEELTGGEAGSPADREGRAFVLRRARDRLRTSDFARRTAILDALPAHTALLDGEGRIVMVNEAWRLFDAGNSILSPGYDLDSNYLEILEAASGGEASVAREVAGGIRSVMAGAAKSFATEYPCHSKTRDRWFLLTATPLQEDNGRGAVVMHLDITAQRQGEESLRRFGAAIDAIEDAVYIVDRASMRFIHINDAACRMQGRTREEMAALGPYGILSISRAELERTYDALIASGVEAEPLELLRPRRNAPDAWVELRRRAVRSGDRWTIVTLVRDITEQLAHREQLRRFRTAMDFSGDAIVLIDRASLRYIDVNQTMCDMVGRTREELLGLTPMDVFSADRQTLERDYDALISNKGAAAVSIEGEYRRGDGSVVPIETRRRAMQTDQGWVIVATARDIRERRATQGRIAAQNRVHAVLSGINALIARVHDTDELFREACRIAVEAGGFRTAMICRVDRGTARIVPCASVGVDARLMADIERLLGSPETAPKTMIARAIRERRAIVSNRSQNDPQALLRDKHAESGVRSLAVLPLIVSQEAVGVLALYSGEVEFFHAEELRLLTALAADISFGVGNVETQHKLAKLSRIRAVSGEINAAIVRIQDGDELFRECCRIAVEHGGYRMAWIGVADWDESKIRPVASEGAEVGFLRAIEDRFSLRDVSPPDGTLSARAIRENKVMVSNDLSREPGFALENEHLAPGMRSFAVLPLRVADQPIGVLVLYADEVDFFQEEELNLVTQMAGDISFALDRLDKQARLDFLAYYDALTGLANRSLFLERVSQYMRSATGGGHGLAVFLVDLERFKNINDSLGQAAGDALLRQVAQWLTRNSGDASLLARIGADQFALVLPNIRADGDLVRLVEKTLDAFVEHPFLLAGTELRISAKVGVALFPEDAGSADALLKDAEAALKKAKSGGEKYLFYTPKMTAKVAGALTLETKLRRALDREEFVLHYQPKISLASGKLTGAEALIRWNDPAGGLIPPGHFIPILETTGLIYEVGRWALRQAIADYLGWRNAGLPAVRIAVNVSPLQLRNRGFVAEIEKKTGVDPQAAAGLELEITESLIMADVSLSIASLKAIRDLGVSIAIDDFGTGFSSLSYLSRLPADKLKIDRSFVVDMSSGPQGLALVATIINLAHSIEFKVVAEGVETEEQARLLRLLGCDEMQGYLISRPVPADVFERNFLTAA